MIQMINKEIVTWLPKNRLLVKQLWHSFLSFITLPFFHSHTDGIKTFFENNYYIKSDELIFDGSTFEYYSKIERTIDISVLNDYNIIDLGCGLGSLYHWLQTKNICAHSFTGLDFAIKNLLIGDNAVLINDNLSNVNNYFFENTNNIVFMTNALCYTDDVLFKNALRCMRNNDELIIIDPSSNIFWDAHFNGIKPIYRKVNRVMQMLIHEEFEIVNILQDYWFAIGGHHFFPLSYCIHAIKMVQGNDFTFHK
ncbi:hypothetical protein FACS1894190_11300 [Spirochaetia bacterium]|nr:hypothetical protein FACS1894190_11300 [Spirochaetia bacterium]